jgi:hypothetical protein
MKNYLDLGNWNALCDSCGRKFKADQLRRRWDGMMVCSEDYELRHPSDFLRVQKERISVPWARPYPASDTYVTTDVIVTEASTTIPPNTDYLLQENGIPLSLES